MTAVQIGISKQSVEAVQKAILAILNCKASDHLKETALETLPRIATTTGTTVSLCTLTATEKGVSVKKTE